MPRKLSDMADIVAELEQYLKSALEAEEKKLLEQRALITAVYEGITGKEFIDKTSTDLAVLHLNGFLREFAPTFFSSVEQTEDTQ